LKAFQQNSSAKDGLSTWCIHCIELYGLRKKATEPHDLWAQKKAYRERASQIKAEKGCQRCLESFEGCLEFHHKSMVDKLDTIPNLIKRGFDWEVIQEEIDKCEVLCANCHRKVHVH
jgi:hypothetical protein